MGRNFTDKIKKKNNSCKFFQLQVKFKFQFIRHLTLVNEFLNMFEVI